MSIADIKAKFSPAKYALDSVRDLSLRLVREFQCPRCQIEDNVRSVLVPIPTAGSDRALRCYFCGEDFPTPDRK